MNADFEQVDVRIDGQVTIKMGGYGDEGVGITFPIHTHSRFSFMTPIMTAQQMITRTIQDHAVRAAGQAVQRLKRIEFFPEKETKTNE